MTENLDRAPESTTGGAADKGGAHGNAEGAGPDNGARETAAQGAFERSASGPDASGKNASGQSASERGGEAVLLGGGPDAGPDIGKGAGPDIGNDAGDAGEGGAPEPYEAFFVPDGFEVNPDLMAEFTGQARALGLNQAQAQQLVDLQIKTQEAGLQAYREQLEAWRTEVVRDPEFGGPRLETALKDAKRALAAYPEGEALLDELSRTGYGNNPHVIRYFARLGREHFPAEDAVITGKEAPGEEPPLEERLWPDKQR